MAAQSCDISASTRENIAATPVQTVVDVQPTEQHEQLASKSVEIKKEISEVKAPSLAESRNESPASDDLTAVFVWDTVKDGSILPPNHTFEQTWVLCNEGKVPWPAGCSVKFVGGDYMGAVDPAHPAGIHELVSASESTVCYNALNPGQRFPFTVLMRTPEREGKVISYWRLTTPDGAKFGHKLWCDVNVEAPPKAEQVVPVLPVVVEDKAEVEEAETETEVEAEAEVTPEAAGESRMIIPKLEHESPSASIHGDRSEVEVETDTNTLAPSADDEDDFEDCGGQDDWADESDDGFMTDEEYDILDASDEEFLSEQQRMLYKK
jgi:next-to-BRCA1 protein 1